MVFGLTWQTFLAYIAAMVSKEAALGVLGSLYLGAESLFSATVGSEGVVATGLSDVLLTSLSPSAALAFIFAVTFSPPCLMAITSTYQETRSLKWTLRILGYYVATSLLIAFWYFIFLIYSFRKGGYCRVSKLISLLNSGKMYSQYELSEELGVSTETLQEYIEYLSERGFLKEVEFQKMIIVIPISVAIAKAVRAVSWGKLWR